MQFVPHLKQNYTVIDRCYKHHVDAIFRWAESTSSCMHVDVTSVDECIKAHPRQTCTWTVPLKYIHFSRLRAWISTCRSQCCLRYVFHIHNEKCDNEIGGTGLGLENYYLSNGPKQCDSLTIYPSTWRDWYPDSSIGPGPSHCNDADMSIRISDYREICVI